MAAAQYIQYTHKNNTFQSQCYVQASATLICHDVYQIWLIRWKIAPFLIRAVTSKFCQQLAHRQLSQKLNSRLILPSIRLVSVHKEKLNPIKILQWLTLKNNKLLLLHVLLQLLLVLLQPSLLLLPIRVWVFFNLQLIESYCRLSRIPPMVSQTGTFFMAAKLTAPKQRWG